MSAFTEVQKSLQVITQTVIALYVIHTVYIFGRTLPTTFKNTLRLWVCGCVCVRACACVRVCVYVCYVADDKKLRNRKRTLSQNCRAEDSRT